MCAPSDPDQRIAALAEGQHGPVAHRQLRAVGLTNREIGHRLAVGRLHRIYPEVYLVGHRVLPREGRWMAAVLTCGRRAVLSHADAAALWGLMPSRGRRIHVTTPSRSGRVPAPGRIFLHRVGTLRPWERTVTDAIPATTVARTILDVSRHLRTKAIEDAIAQADRLGIFDLTDLQRCLAEHPRRPGAPRLRRVLGDLAAGPVDLRSVLEVRMLQLCEDYSLPRPVANARVAGMMVDFLWPVARLVVETDGFAHHRTRTAFERDRERDQLLALDGYAVVRFTYRQVTRTVGQAAFPAAILRRSIVSS